MNRLNGRVRALVFGACIGSFGAIAGLQDVLAQQPGASDQDRNRQQLADVLVPRAGFQQRGLAQPALAPSKSAQDLLSAIKAKSGAIAKAPNSAQRFSLRTEAQSMNLHLAQIVRAAPDYSNPQPDPLVATVMDGPSPALNHILLWNKAALDLTSIDFASSRTGELHPEFGEQLGPPCTSRALAIVHLAMFEALNAIDDIAPSGARPKRQKYISFSAPGATATVADAIFTNGLTRATVTSATTDESSAIRAAAIQTLSSLYRAKTSYFQAVFGEPDRQAISKALGVAAQAKIDRGTQVGKAAADAVLAMRQEDGSQIVNNGVQTCDVGGSVLPDGTIVKGTGTVVGTRPDVTPPITRATQYRWVADPLHPSVTTALGSYWGVVKGFAFTDVSMFKLPDPDTTSLAFRQSFELASVVGGDNDEGHGDTPTSGKPTPHLRTADQTFAAIFWAYDGTPGLCAPPRLYNMIVTSVATSEKPVTDPIEMARLLATVNIAMADAGVAAWSEKYIHDVARPVSAIQKQTDDGVSHYADWTPLGAQVTNTTTRNFTPPFPSYPSGHAVFGASVFQVLRRFWQVDEAETGTSFVFISDEYNGQNVDPATGKRRPVQPRHFATFRDAEEENGLSRVFLGIHWKIDADMGIKQGRMVGDNAYNTLFAKVP